MPNQSKVFYFINLKYPQYITTSSLDEKYARINIDFSVLTNITIDSVDYDIVDSHIELSSSYDFIASENYYLYVANVKGLSPTVNYNIRIKINQKFPDTSLVTIRNVATNEEVSCSGHELYYLRKLAFINSICVMKILYADYNKFLKTSSMQFHSEMMSFLALSAEESYEKIVSIIDKAMQIEAMGGNKFTEILQKMKLSLENAKSKAITQDDSLDEEYCFIETASSEQEKNKALLALSKKIALQTQFKRNIEILDNMHSRLRESKANIDVSSATEYASFATIFLKQALSDEIDIELADLKVIYVAHKESEIFCNNLLLQALSKKTEEPLDDRLLSYMQTTKIDSLLYLLNNGFNRSFSMLIDALDVPLNFIEFNHDDFEKPISLLEIATIKNNHICFLKLLNEGVEPIFITSNGRVLIHDILQVYPIIANIVVGGYITKIKQDAFFKLLIQLTRTWSQTFVLDRIEIDELYVKLAEYRGNIDAEEISYPIKDLSYFDSVTLQVLEITGLTKSMLNSFRPIQAFQKLFIEFNLAYQNYTEIIHDNDMHKLKSDSPNSLFSLISAMHKKPCVIKGQTLTNILEHLQNDISILNLAIEIIQLNSHYHDASLRQTNRKNKKQMKPIKEAFDNLEKKQHEFYAICETRFAAQELPKFSFGRLSFGLFGMLFPTTLQQAMPVAKASISSESTDEEYVWSIDDGLAMMRL